MSGHRLMLVLPVATLIAMTRFTHGQVTLSGDPSKIPPNPHKRNTATEGTISMGTPDLSDEDSMAIHMPKYLSCDACRIISMRFSDSFTKEIEKFPSIKSRKRELSEDRIDDILEGICNDEWTQYGIKEVDGENRLSGPGFETSDIPGVMQGGGKWPFRFKQFCNVIIGDIGEDVIYQTFRKSEDKGLEQLMCYSEIEGSPSFCSNTPKSGKDRKAKKNAKDSKNKHKKRSRRDEL